MKIKNISLFSLLALTLALSVGVVTYVQATPPEPKVKICHNDENWHVIEVAEAAVPAHVPGHEGDFIVENEGDEEECEGRNEQDSGSITIVKEVEGEVEDWSFGFSSDSDFGNFTLDNDDPSRTEDDLDPGDYTVTEEDLPDNWEFEGIDCDPDDNVQVNGQSVTISLEEGEHVTCTFTNEEDQGTAQLRAFKYFDVDQNGSYDDGDYPLSGWSITLYSDNGFTNIGTKVTGEDGYTDYWTDVSVADADELWLQEDPIAPGWVAINPPDDNGFGTYQGLDIEGGGSYDFPFGNWHDDEVRNSCPLPDDLNDTDDDEVGEAPDGEEDLQDILDGQSYGVDVMTDQLQTQFWNVDSGSDVTISGEFIAEFAGNNSVFGYYVDGDLNTFVGLFRTGDVPAPHDGLPLGGSFGPLDVSADYIGFAIKTYSGDTLAGTFATENDLNPNDSDQVVVYNPESGKYVLAFEDIEGGESDYDYNDLVVELTLECEDEEDTATIHAVKIVCDSEDDLPNWGDGDPEFDITSNTATRWLNANPDNGCHLESDWQFEWAPSQTENPGDNENDTDWTDFSGSVNVPAGALVWIREQLPEGYIPFSGDTDDSNGWDDVSAELYCNTDVLNYDNYDWIDPVVAGEDYYCIGFNVPVNQCVDELQGSWADEVEDNEQGNRKDGSDVLLARSDPTLALGPSDWDPGDPDGFYSLGFGGWIVLSFDSFVPDVDGNDISIHEATNGTYPLETVDVEVSQDGTNWYLAGTADNTAGDKVTYLDFSGTGLAWIKYVRITDTTNSALHTSDADGFDLDAVDVTQQVCEEPEEETATIIVVKDAIPDDPQDFDFNMTGQPEFSLDDDDDGTLSNSRTFEELTPGIDYTIGESALSGWDLTSKGCQGTNWNNQWSQNGDGSISVNLQAGSNVTCTFTNTKQEESPTTATISATKIVCDSESDLPNWGDGESTLQQVTSNTATRWLAANPGNGCELESDWQFEWASDETGNPGDNVEDGGTGWTNFSLTDVLGVATATVPSGSPIKVREELKSGYIQFSGDTSSGGGWNDVSAEFYCSDDVLNYDNLDIVGSVEAGETYYCVGFNVQESAKIQVVKNTTDGNGTFAFTGTGVEPGLELTTVDNTASSFFFDVFADVDGETYDVVETQQENWTLVSISCVYDNQSVGVEIENGEEVTVFPGDEVTCTFTNDFTPPQTPTPQCSDNVDNGDEEDSLADENDPGCWTDPNDPDTYNEEDNNESNTAYQCSDGIDNIDSEDSLIDSADPGCHSDGDANNANSWVPTDDDETDTTQPNDLPQCSDNIDNDDDGEIDFGDDAGCDSDRDNDEEGESSGGGGNIGNGVSGSVLGATTDLCSWDSSYMRRGWKGNIPDDVKKVQNDLLNGHEGNVLVVDGIYGPKTEAAVKAFQAKYATEILAPWGISSPTGHFYLSSLHQAQALLCPTNEAPFPPLINWSQNPLVAKI